MPGSRALAVLAAVLPLAGAASVGLAMAAGAATADVVHGAPATSSSPSATATASPVPTTVPSPYPSQSPLDTITVAPVVATAAPGGEQLSVTATSTTALASMTVHLLDATTNADTMDLTMNPPAGGPQPGPSTWTSDVIAMPSLPLGTYNVTVDAADAGTSVTAAPAGTFAFQETPAIIPDPVNAVVSYDNQTPVVSGTVTVLTPGATTPAQYASQPVFIADPRLPGGGVSVDTDASGRYSYTFADPGPGETFTVGVLPTPAVAAASSPPVTFSVQADPVAVSASLSAKSVLYGSKVTVSGTVTYKPGATFVPLHGLAVQIFVAGLTQVTTALTDASGHFTAVLPRQAGSVQWVVRAGGPYLTTATVTLPMKVSLPTVISGFQASLSQFWQLSFRGCLTLPAGDPGAVPSLSGLIIQYAAGPNGPWRTLGGLPKQNTVLCGNGGRAFSGTLTARLNYAYYRAWYPGGTNGSGTGYLASASGRVLAWKYADRITAFTVSSRAVPGNGKLTVRGQLQYYSGQWRDYAGQRVYVILRPQGSSTWYFIVYATTNSAGRFSVTFTDPVTATWSAEFFGNSAHLATLAATIFVRVT